MPYVTVDVEVDVDLSDFGTDDLRKELADRDGDTANESFFFQANRLLRMGFDEQALEMLREECAERLGVVAL